MYYENLHNYIGSEHKVNYYDKEKIMITKRHGSLDYTLRWSDLSLWGTFYLGKEFVRYSKIRLFERLPEELSIMENSEDSCFVKEGNYYICNEIGRYKFIINNKKWIVDVIFPIIKDAKWSEEQTNEYLSGITGVRLSWTYDLNDASMADFLMRIISTIETKDKNIDYIVRKIMLYFSSENTKQALLEGRWDRIYEDGTHPLDWDHTSQIYRARENSLEPIKYGQCWVFAECMTAAMKFLGIATRTIHAKNSHINISKNFAIDIFGYSNSEKGYSNDIYYKKIENLHSFIFSSEKSEEREESLSGRVYCRKDTMWNFHYWNEIYSYKGWKCLDSTPVIESNDEPFMNNKILGPCPVLNIRSGIYEPSDFTYLASSVNSPIRLWSKTVVTINGVNEFISFVHSIVFPFYPEKSIISRLNSTVLHQKNVILQTKCKSLIDITENYKMNYEKVNEMLYKNHPAIFIFINDRLYVDFDTENEEDYIVQQLCLDNRGIVINSKKNKCKLWEIIPINIEIGTKFITTTISSNNQVWPQILKI